MNSTRNHTRVHATGGGWGPVFLRTGGWGDGRSYFGEGVSDGFSLFAVGDGVVPPLRLRGVGVHGAGESVMEVKSRNNDNWIGIITPNTFLMPHENKSSGDVIGKPI